MKTRILFLIFFTIVFIKGNADPFMDKYGIGIVKVGYTIKDGGMPDRYWIDLYDTLCDTIPSAQRHIFFDKTPLYDSLRSELNYLHFDFIGGVEMVCIEKRGDWFKVRIK